MSPSIRLAALCSLALPLLAACGDSSTGNDPKDDRGDLDGGADRDDASRATPHDDASIAPGNDGAVDDHDAAVDHHDGGSIDDGGSAPDAGHEEPSKNGPRFIQIADPSQRSFDDVAPTFRPLSALLDVAGERLLAVGSSAGTGFRVELNCRKLDGSACTEGGFALLSSADYGSYNPSAALDDTGEERALLVVSDDIDRSVLPFEYPLMLRRCPLDGAFGPEHCSESSVTFKDTGTPVSAAFPAIALDRAGKTLLIATANPDHGVTLLRCALDGTSCVPAAFSSGSNQAPSFPSITIDTAQNKVVVAFWDHAGNVADIGLLSCDLPDNLELTGCVEQSVTGVASGSVGAWPSVVYDPQSESLFATAQDDKNAKRPQLHRCTKSSQGEKPYACVSIDLSSLSDAVDDAGWTPSVSVHGGEVLMVTMNVARSFYPWLFRCKVDGTGCRAQDWSGDNRPLNDSGYFPVGVAHQATLNVFSLWLPPEAPRKYQPVLVRGAL